MVRLGNVLIIFLAARFSICDGQTTKAKVTAKGPVVTAASPKLTSPAKSNTFAAYKEAVIVVVNNMANKAPTTLVDTTLAPEDQISSNMTANLIELKTLMTKLGSSLDKLSVRSLQVAKTSIHPGDDPREKTVVTLFTAADRPYWIYHEPRLSFDDAFNWCKEFGLQLLSIETREEDAALFELYTTIDQRFWTSGNHIETPFSFVWKSTGNSFGYANFLAGDPNNFGGNERCVAVGSFRARTQYTPVQSWIDIGCDGSNAFICEKP